MMINVSQADGVMMRGNIQIGLISQTGCGPTYPDISQRLGFHLKTIKSVVANWKGCDYPFDNC